MSGAQHNFGAEVMHCEFRSMYTGRRNLSDERYRLALPAHKTLCLSTCSHSYSMKTTGSQKVGPSSHYREYFAVAPVRLSIFLYCSMLYGQKCGVCYAHNAKLRDFTVRCMCDEQNRVESSAVLHALCSHAKVHCNIQHLA